MTEPRARHLLRSRVDNAIGLSTLEGPIQDAADRIVQALRAGHKVLLFGNGGSASDAQHIAAELVGRFVRERRPLAAIALTTDTSILTAVANDYGYEQVFARQVLALGSPGDIAVAISTSGSSPNVLEGVQAAREQGLTVIGLTGRDGGRLAEQADVVVNVAGSETALIQEGHIAVGHILCELVDDALFPAPDPV